MENTNEYEGHRDIKKDRINMIINISIVILVASWFIMICL